MVVTEGGPIDELIADGAENLGDDPIFSVGGDLAFNWVYKDKGLRVVLIPCIPIARKTTRQIRQQVHRKKVYWLWCTNPNLSYFRHPDKSVL